MKTRFNPAEVACLAGTDATSLGGALSLSRPPIENNRIYFGLDLKVSPDRIFVRFSTSGLVEIIPPEIKDDAFYRSIRELSLTQPFRHVLEIGFSAGVGRPEGVVAGMAENPGNPKLLCIEVSKPRFEVLRKPYGVRHFDQCYNIVTVAPVDFPSLAEVKSFY